jgi:hypothetical protein
MTWCISIIYDDEGTPIRSDYRVEAPAAEVKGLAAEINAIDNRYEATTRSAEPAFSIADIRRIEADAFEAYEEPSLFGGTR